MSAVRCPTCGARNADGAPWCTQCYASLSSPTPGPAGATVTEPVAGDGDPQPQPGHLRGAPATTGDPGSGGTGAAPGRAASDRPVREAEDGSIEWRCGTCETWTPLEAPACVACGTTRAGFGETDTGPREIPEPTETLLLSALVPGLGHIRAGLVGTGVARAVVAVVWLAGGIGLLVSALRAGSTPWAAMPLLLGALVVWVLTFLDTRTLVTGGRTDRLGGRSLLWLIAGVTGALIVVLLVDTLRAAAG